MRKILLMSAVLFTGLKATYGSDTLTTDLLQSYYNIKNALVAGDGKTASTEADLFLMKVNGIDYKIISEGNIKILAKDAGRIASITDISKQRKYFENLSTNMALVAKSVRLSAAPVYVIYCPMKKATWLNHSAEIANPYYGSSMLTCGTLQETIK